MPRFFFDVHDGRSQIDSDGTDLRDLDHARCEALRLAGAILTEDAARIQPGEDWRLEVRDAGGLLLYRLDLSLVAAPAVGHGIDGLDPGEAVPAHLLRERTRRMADPMTSSDEITPER